MANPAESDVYGVTHFVIVKDVHSKMENQETIRSKEFSCQEDPNSVGLHIDIKFGTEFHGWLSVYLSTSSDGVTNRSLIVRAYDLDGTCLTKATDPLPPQPYLGFPKFLAINNTSSAQLKIVVECQYYVDQDKLPSKASELRA